MAQKEKTLKDFIRQHVNYDTKTICIYSYFDIDFTLEGVKNDLLSKFNNHCLALNIKLSKPKDSDIYFREEGYYNDAALAITVPNETEENKKSRIKNEEILAEKEYNKYLERKGRAKNLRDSNKKKRYEKLKEELAALEKELK